MATRCARSRRSGTPARQSRPSTSSPTRDPPSLGDLRLADDPAGLPQGRADRRRGHHRGALRIGRAGRKLDEALGADREQVVKTVAWSQQPLNRSQPGVHEAPPITGGMSLSETSRHFGSPGRPDAADPARAGRLTSAARPIATLAAASLLGGRRGARRRVGGRRVRRAGARRGAARPGAAGCCQGADRIDGHRRRRHLPPQRPRRRPDHLDLPRSVRRRRLRQPDPGPGPAGARIGLRDRQGRPHRHQLPRRPGRFSRRGQLFEPGHRQGEGGGHRSVHRPRLARGGSPRQGSHAALPRRLGRGAGRRPRGRDRQPVRARPHRDGRDRQRAAARGPVAEQLHDRPRDPDRRADQQRQLRRPADRRAGTRDRRQLADRDRERRRRQRRHRVRRPLQHRQERRRAAPRRRPRRPRLSRRDPAGRELRTSHPSYACRQTRASSSGRSSRAAPPRRRA